MEQSTASGSAQSSTSNPQCSILVFLSAISFGLVAPMLYFIIDLPDGIWIGLLFAVGSIARILGRGLLDKTRLSVALGQLIAVIGYGLIAITGAAHLSHQASLSLIYLAVFLIALVTASYPSVLSFTQGTGGAMFRSRRFGVIGFIFGCTIAAAISHRTMPSNVLATRDLFYGGLTAGCVSAGAAIFAFAASVDCVPSTVMSPEPACRKRTTITLTAECAFAMAMSAAPLFFWESYAIHPAQLALFFAVASIAGLAAGAFTQSALSERIATQAGLLLSAMGFIGFAIVLWIWGTRPVDGFHVGLSIVWIAGILAGSGQGVLRSSLPGDFKRPILVDCMSAIIIGASAVFSSMIWATHERASLALPGVIALGAIGMTLVRKRIRAERSAGVVASAATDSS